MPLLRLIGFCFIWTSIWVFMPLVRIVAWCCDKDFDEEYLQMFREFERADWHDWHHK